MDLLDLIDGFDGDCVRKRPGYVVCAVKREVIKLSIPASSCECERMFSKLGDLLEPRRRNLGPQLLAALQCIRAWIRIGMITPGSSDAVLNDSDLARLYDLSTWDQPL
jgi:hypothetical protein